MWMERRSLCIWVRIRRSNAHVYVEVGVIKTVILSSEYQKDVVIWLTENVGTENVRWWIQGSIGLNLAQKPGLLVSLDVTEEEPLITAFLLKWG